jgi:hypothetical protein
MARPVPVAWVFEGVGGGNDGCSVWASGVVAASAPEYEPDGYADNDRAATALASLARAG